MSEEQLKALLARLATDSGLQQQLRAAGDLEAVAALVKQAGFDVSQSELEGLSGADFALTEQELESVAGGGKSSSNGNTICRTGTKRFTPTMEAR